MKKEHMKKAITIIMLWMMVIIPTYATGQRGDWIYWKDGGLHRMLATPLWSNEDEGVKNLLKQWSDNFSSTDNWDGYTGFWSIKGNTLYLDSVRPDKGQTLYPAKMPEFKKYLRGGRVVASWVTDTLRIVFGTQIYYEHSGFNRYYEHEEFVAVKNGVVGTVQSYDQKCIFEEKTELEMAQLYPPFNKSLEEKLKKQFPDITHQRYLIYRVRYTGADPTSPTGITFTIRNKENMDKNLVTFLKQEIGSFLLEHHVQPLYLIKGKPWYSNSTFPFL